MKRLTFLIVAIAFLVFLIGVFWWKASTGPVAAGSQPSRNFIVAHGSSATEIGNQLASEDLIKSALAFKIYVQTHSLADKIQTGEYSLSPSMNLSEVITKLLKGPDELWVTIPEGYRREEIALKVISTLGVTNPSEFYSEFMQSSQGKEGYLFPDTYLFPKDVSASDVVAKMNETFNSRFDNAMKQELAKSKYSLNEIITMASLIERETKTAKERPVVAGILWKRLETPGWYLQVDASIQYLVSTRNCSFSALQPCSYSMAKSLKWWPELTKADLAINSDYNTYKYAGLPPTPIANPGLSSIKAALEPQNSPYWFYLHDSSGNVHFSKTIEEHNTNIRLYLGS